MNETPKIAREIEARGESEERESLKEHGIVEGRKIENLPSNSIHLPVCTGYLYLKKKEEKKKKRKKKKTHHTRHTHTTRPPQQKKKQQHKKQQQK